MIDVGTALRASAGLTRRARGKGDARLGGDKGSLHPYRKEAATRVRLLLAQNQPRAAGETLPPLLAAAQASGRI